MPPSPLCQNHRPETCVNNAVPTLSAHRTSASRPKRSQRASRPDAGKSSATHKVTGSHTQRLLKILSKPSFCTTRSKLAPLRPATGPCHVETGHVELRIGQIILGQPILTSVGAYGSLSKVLVAGICAGASNRSSGHLLLQCPICVAYGAAAEPVH